MKKYLSLLLAIMMVLSTVSFAAPAMTGVVNSASEETETVPEAIIAFLESSSFEDAIRKAVSMGGDSDTLACITGGIAEAFYREIPEEMILETKRVFPQIFHKILDAMKINTAYGKQNK